MHYILGNVSYFFYVPSMLKLKSKNALAFYLWPNYYTGFCANLLTFFTVFSICW